MAALAVVGGQIDRRLIRLARDGYRCRLGAE
jgi:hypothetical protein